MSTKPEVGVIARVGAHQDLERAGARSLAAEIRQTPFGPSNPVHTMVLDDVRFAILSRHGESGYEIAAPFVNDRANLYALKDLGVEKVVSFSSPGSLDPSINAGDLVLPDDVLDERRQGPFTFFEGKGIGVIRQAHPFCPGLRLRFRDALVDQGFSPRFGGVYAGTQGPRLETPAEIRKLRLLGGTVVGMTLVPELFLARELELCYAAVCLVVNQAEGLKNTPYREGVLFEGLADEEEMKKVRSVEERAGALIAGLIRTASIYGRACACGKSMERYKLRGDISRNWRNWWD